MATARGIAVEDIKQARKKKKDVGEVSQTTLIRRRFMQSKLSVFGFIVLFILYVLAIFAPFIAPYDYNLNDTSNSYKAPTQIKFINGAPSVCGVTQKLNTATFTWKYTTDCSKSSPIKFFVHGWPYKLFGIIPSTTHLFGVQGKSKLYLFGADGNGRDLLSRLLIGSRVSLSIGLVGVTISVVIGSILGTASGYFGGAIDNVMQRIIELLLSVPTISLFMAIAAALPQDMSVVKRYFLISIITSLIGWTGLARQVRGKVMGYKNQDFSSAARLAGASHWRIIVRHLLPNSSSHIIVSAALAVPGTILAETSLSFLGLGMLPPAVSWGVLLNDAQKIQVVERYPWLLIPAGAVILAVTCFFLIADGLRDAVDPYS